MILARTRPSRFLPAIMFVWGLVTVGMAWVPTYHGLIGFRVVVGVLEAGFAPGVLLLLSSWYKKSEQSKRFAVYISAAILSGAFGGLLAGAITSGLDGVHGLAGWRWLFIVEGAATSAWSIVAAFILLDFPANSKRLTEAERRLAILRLKSESLIVHSEDQPELGHLAALKVALGNWRTWMFVVGYMVRLHCTYPIFDYFANLDFNQAIVGSSTLSYFYPTLVNGLGYDPHIAQYMTIPIYIVAFVCTAVTGIFMDRYPSKRGYVLGAWMSVAMICAIIICAVYNFKARYALLIIMASALWASNGLALSYTSSTFSEAAAEVRAILLAFVNAMGNLAQIYGAYLFPSDDQPKYLMGFGVISGLCFTGVAAYVGLAVLLKKWPVKK